MPFNGSGGFVPVSAPDYPPLAGQPIYASQFIANIADIHSGLGNCLTRDGQSPPTQNIPMNGMKLTNVGDGTADGDALGYGQAALVAGLGALATPSFSFLGDLDTGMWSPGADILAWSNAGVETLRLDAAGNLRLGGTPRAWGSSVKALESGSASFSGGTAARMAYNLYYDGTNWRYMTTAAGVLLQDAANGLIFYTAPSGTAGNVATITEMLAITLDGRIHGSALHNNAGTVSGAVDQYIASGTYTPTFTAVAGGPTVGTNSGAVWMRVGNVVTVAGRIAVTAVAASQFRLTLPIASNLGGLGDLAGAAGDINTTAAAAITADATNNAALFVCSGANPTLTYTFSYEVL